MEKCWAALMDAARARTMADLRARTMVGSTVKVWAPQKADSKDV